MSDDFELIDALPICFDCKNYLNRDGRGEDTCTAFPGGIPAEIMAMRFIHDKPYDGDSGIRFEPIGVPEKE